MYNPQLKWNKSPSGDVVQYNISWKINSVAAGSGVYSRSQTKDSTGYDVTFSTHNPGITLVDGDTVEATVVAVDAVSLTSAPVTASIVLPSEPPLEPTNVTLILS